MFEKKLNLFSKCGHKAGEFNNIVYAFKLRSILMKENSVCSNLYKSPFHKARFALIELMLTAAVLAIIAVLVIPFFSRANQKGRYTTWVNQKNRVLSDVDLTVYYDFTDGQGSIVRNMARGFHKQEYDPIIHDARVIKGAAWVNGRWQMKPALEFDGSSGYVSANAEFSDKSVTYILWVRPNETSGGLLMTSKSRKTDSPSRVRVSINKGIVGAAVKRKKVFSKDVCQKSKWHMVAVTAGEKYGALKLYLDGKFQGEVKDITLKSVDQKSFLLGFASGAGHFSGRMGEFMAFSRELTLEEILKIYEESYP